MRDSQGSLLRDLGFITGNQPDLGNYVAAAVVEAGTVFSATVEFLTALQNGATATVRNRILGLLDRGLDALESARTEVGVRENRIERARERADKFKENALDVASRLEEADLAQVITDLRQQETVQEAALRATAQVLQNSLLQFL
jgi:flagellar hook-associated protein 3 FlgL